MARILIVDDDAHTVAVLALWLEEHGYDILRAPNGAEALGILAAESVDLIISDVNMPRLNGLEFAKAVREERGLKLPFMMLTSRCNQSELERAMKSYDVDVYPKPFMPSRLVTEIGRLLGATTT